MILKGIFPTYLPYIYMLRFYLLKCVHQHSVNNIIVLLDRIFDLNWVFWKISDIFLRFL